MNFPVGSFVKIPADKYSGFIPKELRINSPYRVTHNDGNCIKLEGFPSMFGWYSMKRFIVADLTKLECALYGVEYAERKTE